MTLHATEIVASGPDASQMPFTQKKHFADPFLQHRHVLLGLEDGEHRHTSMHQLGLFSKGSGHGLLRIEPGASRYHRIASNSTPKFSSTSRVHDFTGPAKHGPAKNHTQSQSGASQSQQLEQSTNPGV